MRNTLARIPAPTLGAYVRRDHHRIWPYGFEPLSGFPLAVRCSTEAEGYGTEESVRIRAEFRFIDAKRKPHLNPARIIEWWLVAGFDEALRAIARRYPHDYTKSYKVLLDGTGMLVPE
ncbi:MAG TPA: hypothetical protein VNU25_01170 [Candidatus Paceibacterota bacterium]|nr:hypothetical protein [Candidatus Paceibacterota bacterium]